MRVTSGSFSPRRRDSSASSGLVSSYRSSPTATDIVESNSFTLAVLDSVAHDLFEHTAGIDPERVSRGVDFAVRHDVDPVVLDFANRLWRMGRGDELAFREGLLEVPYDPPLPRRMEMKLDLVDQHDRPGLSGRVVHLRIHLHQPAGQVEHQRQHPPFSVGERLNWQRHVAAVDEEQGSRVCPHRRHENSGSSEENALLRSRKRRARASPRAAPNSEPPALASNPRTRPNGVRAGPTGRLNTRH